MPELKLPLQTSFINTCEHTLVFLQDTCLSQGTLSECLYLRQFFNISLFSHHSICDFIYHKLSELCTEDMIIDIFLELLWVSSPE